MAADKTALEHQTYPAEPAANVGDDASAFVAVDAVETVAMAAACVPRRKKRGGYHLRERLD